MPHKIIKMEMIQQVGEIKNVETCKYANMDLVQG